jgi:putative transposase
MTRTPDRQHISNLVEHARSAGARLADTAEALGISERTLRRWRAAEAAGNSDDQRVHAVRPKPANALSEQERQAILDVCHQPEFASRTPMEIVPELADRGEYLGSERTFYRVLRAHRQLARRGRARAPKPRRPPATHCARAPGEVWVWDITWLPAAVRGTYYRFYMIMDLYSRKIIASEVWESENAENSQTLIQRAVLAEQLVPVKTPVLHGDNGSPLKAGTVQLLMQNLGITPSHSRPRVSNDNAHAEAFFRTAKYHPTLNPEGFDSLDAARCWVHEFVQWYNTEHKHSAIGFVTPEQKHRGEDVSILAHRSVVYEAKRAEHPERWIKGKCRPWKPVVFTTLNPVSPREHERDLKKSA